ncbi:zinc finger protein 578-like [Procambarus clarkii]|nr:zinc finger protein 680-like [Procambarus clarkii]
MKHHMLQHMNDEPHKCPDCGKSYSLRGNMKKRVKVDTGVTSHKCEECEKSQLTNMKRQEEVHSDDRVNRCPSEQQEAEYEEESMPQNMLVKFEIESDEFSRSNKKQKVQ